MVPQVPFNGDIADAQQDDLYAADDRATRLFAIGAGLAVLIANLVAWPLAFVAMRTWLAGFDDRIALSPLYFVGASAFALVIAVLTVLAQSLRESRAAPAWALRDGWG